MATPRNLKITRPDVCTECKAELPIGSEVRYYSREKLYCIGDHTGPEARPNGNRAWEGRLEALQDPQIAPSVLVKVCEELGVDRDGVQKALNQLQVIVHLAQKQIRED
tara:strand:+ start:203 stop:526 length:324 start_codon:yes stop_codon:yes gene_type:complete